VHESHVYCTVVNIRTALIVSGYTYGVEPDFLNVNILCGCSIHCLTAAESVPDFWGGTESMNCLISAYITTIGSSTAAVNEPSVLFMFVNNQSAALIGGGTQDY